MRHLALALLLAAASGCVNNTGPFDVTVTNVGSVTTYLHAGDSTGLLIAFEEEINGEWTFLSGSLEGMCQPRCGGPPGAITCADMAAELLTAHALLPGDSHSRSYDGEFWYSTDMGCARRAPLSGPMRVTVCHDDVVVDFNGDPLPEPSESGPVDADGGEAMLEDANCEVFPIELEPEPAPVVEISED